MPPKTAGEGLVNIFEFSNPIATIENIGIKQITKFAIAFLFLNLSSQFDGKK